MRTWAVILLMLASALALVRLGGLADRQVSTSAAPELPPTGRDSRLPAEGPPLEAAPRDAVAKPSLRRAGAISVEITVATPAELPPDSPARLPLMLWEGTNPFGREEIAAREMEAKRHWKDLQSAHTAISDRMETEFYGFLATQNGLNIEGTPTIRCTDRACYASVPGLGEDEGRLLRSHLAESAYLFGRFISHVDIAWPDDSKMVEMMIAHGPLPEGFGFRPR